MNFLVNTFNHNEKGRRSLEDPMGIIGHQLRALGHQAIYRPSNDQFLTKDMGINLIVEGFTPGAIQALANFHAQGCRFVCVATEEPTERGFNHGKDQEMVWRQKLFPNAAQFFDGILHLVPGENVTKWYSQYAPAACIELGYAPTLVRPTNRNPPTFDFGFFGSVSRRRYKILKHLTKYFGNRNIRICGDFPTQEERDAKMREAKVILQIRKYDEMGLVSSSRCNTALNVGRPVVAEPHDLSRPWDSIVKFTDSMEEFKMIASWTCINWKSTHMNQFERFKQMLTPELCIGEPMKKIQLDLTEPRFKMVISQQREVVISQSSPDMQVQAEMEAA